jgi:hypothetical protein
MQTVHGHVGVVGMVDSEVRTPKTRFVKSDSGWTGRPCVPPLTPPVVMLPATYIY